MSRNSRFVQREITGWVERGLIDSQTGDRLRLDVEARSGGFSASGVLIVMSALLFSASVLILIAANWDGMSRLTRVLLVAAIILIANGTGAWAASLGRRYLADALWLIGSAAFGAGMALVGQMYHLSGDESGLYFVWWISAIASALLLRSKALTLASVALACAWLFARLGDDGFEIFGDLPLAVHGFLPMLAIGWLASLRTDARAARDLVLFALGGYLMLLYWHWGVGVAMLTMVLSVAAFVWAIGMKRGDNPALAPKASLAAHALLQFLLAGALLHVTWHEGVGMAVVAVIIISGLIGALLQGGRDDAGVRRLVYVAFAVELVFVYVQTVGSMIGTFGFLVLGAIALAAFARLVTKFERRARSTSGEPA